MAVKPDTRRTIRHAVEQYYAIRKTRGIAFSPDGAELAFITNTTGTGEVWRVSTQGGWPHQLTISGRNVAQISWGSDPDQLVYLADREGDENYELFLLSRRGGMPVPLTTAAGTQSHFGDWSPDGKQIAYSSNKRDPAHFDVYVVDSESGAERMLWQDNHANMVLSWSPCGRYLAVQQFEQNANQDLYLLTMASGEACYLTPHEGLVRHCGGVWEPDGEGFLFLTDHGRDFMGLARMDIASRGWKYLETPASDITEVALSRDGRWLALTVNREGNLNLEVKDRLRDRVLDLTEFQQGVTSELTFSRHGDQFAFYHESACRARDLWVIDLPDASVQRGCLCVPDYRQVTFSMIGGIPPEELCMPQVVSYRSFDGLEIPAFLFVPRGGKPDGTLPAVLW
ncbi:MAG: PD40 domain-containing protein, partial [Cyanobacteria bacterium NC_groundwater_1444_Ag_S-0.65um_54_12]|nr:PD40 domain-containing protein [Cyanobacteria bacterium NC_groundwater_1444_Ag_S-0.65um_54_12]